MSDVSRKHDKRRKAGTTDALTMPGIYLLVFAFCGWLILMANMFGIAGPSGWVFPVVNDIAGMAASTVLMLVLGLTPLALRQLLNMGRKAGK